MIEGFKPGDRVRVKDWPREANPDMDANGREGVVSRFSGSYVIVALDVPPPGWSPLSTENGLYCFPSELVKL